MDTNRSFELNVGDFFRSQGYDVDVTRATGDWGVDVFIEKDGHKGAVQVKNYGNCRTSISRKDVMELYGAMAFFDCDFAKIVYNGRMNDDAKLVAEKLGIECIVKEQDLKITLPENIAQVIPDSFYDCWHKYIAPLKEREIETKSNMKYLICDVSDDRIVYQNTKGKLNKVKIDLFKWVFDRLMSTGIVYGKAIRDEFKTTHSSLVVALFAYIPYFEIIDGPYIKIKNALS